jgi:transcriptional regulator with XRE-family HTH domain
MSKAIGTKIKQLRSAQKLELEELAKSAEIESTQLLKIEDDGVVPSISILIKIARTLGVRPGTILDGVEQTGAVVTTRDTNRLLMRSENNVGTAHNNLDFISLAPNKPERNLEPYIVRVAYTVPDPKATSTHEGEEFMYVLEGNIEVRYGTEKHVLGAGDSIYYDSIVPHKVSALEPDTEALILAVTYMPI